MMDTLRNKNRVPTHPGALLRDVVLPELGITQGEFADRLGVSRLIARTDALCDYVYASAFVTRIPLLRPIQKLLIPTPVNAIITMAELEL
jgi:hypothetical protein